MKNEFPKSVLGCGGLIGRIMDYTLDQSHRPNEILAFAGAAAWVAHCCGRRYRTVSNGRPNVYIVAHAWSGVGKSAPRDTNCRLAKACDMVETVVEDFRSGEGLQDTLLTTARLLSQYDEIDTLFDSIKKSRDAIGTNLMGEMMKDWEKSRNFLSRRRLAASGRGNNKDNTPSIAYHPHFTLFGTGVTSEVYKSLSEKMAKNGFFARLCMIDGGTRGEGREPTFREPPNDIVEDCKKLAGWNPVKSEWRENDPAWTGSGEIMPADAESRAFRAECIKEADGRYNREEDGVENAVWNRTVEKEEKWAMIFAASENPHCPVIGEKHWRLARDLVIYSNIHQIEMLAKYSVETDYEDLQKRITRILERGITCNRELLRKLHIKNDELREAVETLQAAGKIIFCTPDGEELPEYQKVISYALA